MEKLFDCIEKGKVVLFGAHPDDVEMGAGGTIARLTAAGVSVTHVIVSVPTEFESRRKEAKRAAEVLGAKHVLLFDRESRVEDIPMHALVRAMDHVIGDLQPDIVFTHSQHDLHWDHGLVNRAVISSLRRTPAALFAFTSSYELNAQSRLIGQCFVDISATMERKLEAIRQHETQLSRLDLEGTRDFARGMGRICGVTYAEPFEVLRLRF